MTNAISLGDDRLYVYGSGGGGAESLIATVNMTDATSEIVVNGADADNIDGFFGVRFPCPATLCGESERDKQLCDRHAS